MQAPGFRMNERESNPNPYIAFIRSLPTKDDHTVSSFRIVSYTELTGQDAEMILKAVAAQMKKIMQQRFMFVGTLEEVEHNNVFAGRNWNYGQSIELVLRGPSGRFLPLRYITSVMCHEMAHIQQMNHGPKFQKLNAEIKEEVRQMQARGNYGDGFWSDGHRLKDNVKMGGEGLRPAHFPEYVCGVTAGDARKARRPRRGPRSSAAPGLVKGEASHRSGRQTEYNRKAGRRNNVDMGASAGRLDGREAVTKEDEEARKEEIEQRSQSLTAQGMEAKKARAKAARDWKKDNPWYTEGNSRGRVAKSKTAAELRAAAAEKRLATLSAPVKLESSPPSVKSEDDGAHDSTGEDGFEADPDVVDPHIDASERRRDMDKEMDEEEKKGLRGGWEEFFPSLAKRPGSSKRPLSPDPGEGSVASRRTKPKQTAVGFGRDMVELEKKKDLGLAPDRRGEQTLGVAPVSTVVKEEVLDGKADGRWACRLCTFSNIAGHGRCDVRGEAGWNDT